MEDIIFDRAASLQDIRALCHVHGLSDTSAETIADLSDQLLSGWFDAEFLPDFLADDLDINEEQAEHLAYDLATIILASYKDALPGLTPELLARWSAQANLPARRPHAEATDLLGPKEIQELAEARRKAEAALRAARVTPKIPRPQDRADKKEAEHQELALRETHALAKRYAALTLTSPTQSMEPVMPLARATATLPHAQVLDQYEKQIPPARLARALASSAPPLPPVEAPSLRPQMSDVLPPRTVLGPLEELRQMRVVEFRRLANTPELAVQKLREKIEFLASEGDRAQVEAVQAWRESPLCRLLTLLARARLTGAADAPSRGATLTPEEEELLSQMNEAIRF